MNKFLAIITDQLPVNWTRDIQIQRVASYFGRLLEELCAEKNLGREEEIVQRKLYDCLKLLLYEDEISIKTPKLALLRALLLTMVYIAEVFPQIFDQMVTEEMANLIVGNRLALLTTSKNISNQFVCKYPYRIGIFVDVLGILVAKTFLEKLLEPGLLLGNLIHKMLNSSHPLIITETLLLAEMSLCICSKKESSMESVVALIGTSVYRLLRHKDNLVRKRAWRLASNFLHCAVTLETETLLKDIYLKEQNIDVLYTAWKCYFTQNDDNRKLDADADADDDADDDDDIITTKLEALTDYILSEKLVLEHIVVMGKLLEQNFIWSQNRIDSVIESVKWDTFPKCLLITLVKNDIFRSALLEESDIFLQKVEKLLNSNDDNDVALALKILDIISMKHGCSILHSIKNSLISIKTSTPYLEKAAMKILYNLMDESSIGDAIEISFKKAKQLANEHGFEEQDLLNWLLKEISEKIAKYDDMAIEGIERKNVSEEWKRDLIKLIPEIASMQYIKDVLCPIDPNRQFSKTILLSLKDNCGISLKNNRALLLWTERDSLSLNDYQKYLLKVFLKDCHQE